MIHSGWVNEINGLPAHVLLIHLVVAGVPLAAVLTVLSGVWPAARRRLGIVTPVVALLALVTVPITAHAGEWLEHHVYINPATESGQAILRHTSIGDELLPWAIGLFLVAALTWGLPKLATRAGANPVSGSPVARIGVGVLAVAIAAVSVVQVYRIGDAGAKAAWSTNFCHVAIPIGASCPTPS